MLCNRDYGCKQINNRTEQLSGVDNFLNTINTHTPRFIDRKTSKLGWTTKMVNISLL